MDYARNRDFVSNTCLRNRFHEGIPMSDQARKLIDTKKKPQMTLVRLTELKKIPLNIMAQSLSNVVYDHLCHSKYALMSRNQILDEIQIRPSSELPWCQMIGHVAQAGRLGCFINYYKRKTII